MNSYNNDEFDIQIKDLLNIIEQHEYRDIEEEYILQLEIIKKDLSHKTREQITEYIHQLNIRISELKLDIIRHFSIRNTHLTEDYLNRLIHADDLLSAKLEFTTKIDSSQHMLAKEKYFIEYKYMLLSFPVVASLSTELQDKILFMNKHIAELSFLSNQHWIIKVE